jgi:hypothetical protein
MSGVESLNPNRFSHSLVTNYDLAFDLALIADANRTDAARDIGAIRVLEQVLQFGKSDLVSCVEELLEKQKTLNSKNKLNRVYLHNTITALDMLRAVENPDEAMAVLIQQSEEKLELAARQEDQEIVNRLRARN